MSEGGGRRPQKQGCERAREKRGRYTVETSEATRGMRIKEKRARPGGRAHHHRCLPLCAFGGTREEGGSSQDRASVGRRRVSAPPPPAPSLKKDAGGSEETARARSSPSFRTFWQKHLASPVAHAAPAWAGRAATASSTSSAAIAKRGGLIVSVEAA